ncbi:hypothetical protein PYK79_37930 [Streptomyces sp. ID05-04B]|uniref:Rv1733c family protein n=1 Tax=unclassified Streptomyces TaxID=2593676 RepID=UPI000D1B6658|nr:MULTISPECIES: hypothetical protein [unclassified Streptomyces]AVV46244.1 hypothetical protein C6376_37750 [Streptomyces sp. P3]MDX5567886.1 hypothetical protein [Streptomyces sp. ID05-04B]
MAFRGRKVWLWRWRRNPLKRRADVVESWVVLGVWALTVLAGVLGGWATAGSVEDGLARERVEWRPLMGRLTDRAPGTPAASGSASGDRVWARVGWTGPDGSAHTGQVRVGPGSAAGTPVTVWTDTRGRMVTEPVGADQARLRAALVGGVAGLGVATLPFAGGRVLRGRLERRRVAQWDIDWARFDALRGRPAG